MSSDLLLRKVGAYLAGFGGSGSICCMLNSLVKLPQDEQ